MSYSDTPAPSAAAPRAQAWAAPDRLLIVVFSATLFMSALLLFVVQPIITKMVLPRLGGSPAVWSVAMCFFQFALLAGYAYAHALSKLRHAPHRVLIHVGFMLAATFALPLGLAGGWGDPPTEGVSLWLIGLFAVSIGLPFVALSANAPLLQAWFARTGHPHASDPYFLYGASNLGSLIALLGFPILIEPYLRLGEQSAAWSLAFQGLIILIGLSGLFMLTREGRAQRVSQAVADAPAARDVAWSDRGRWLLLAFVPSGLLVAVTAHISTDIAAAPFIWVAPLALFLLTFVITFQRRPIIPHRWMLAAQAVLAAPLLVSLLVSFQIGLLPAIALHLTAFFVNAMVCHGELVRRRPAAEHLTEFFLVMSLGGALGGLFAGLAAPHLFSTVAEYPVLVALALLARPSVLEMRRDALLPNARIIAGLLTIAACFKLFVGGAESREFIAPLIAVVILCMVASRWEKLAFKARVGALACVIAGGLATVMFAQNAKEDERRIERYRSFFGVIEVSDSKDGAHRLLKHGTTLHGAEKIQGVDPSAPPEPLTYYHDETPFADALRALRRERALGTIGVVGLGTGSLACYRAPNEEWRYFEIDPLMAQVARDTGDFTFLSKCTPDAEIILGDARLTLAAEPAGFYDVLVLDAFSSDSIPVHLLTREAVQMYLSRMSDDGVLLFHVSNRYLELQPILGGIVDSLGVFAMQKTGERDENFTETYRSAPEVVAIAKTEAALAAATADGRRFRVTARASGRMTIPT